MLQLVFCPLNTILLERFSTSDSIVLFENAVFSLLDISVLNRFQLDIPCLYVLAEELDVRGIDRTQLPDYVKLINYSELVNLTCQHPRIASWT